MLSSLVIRLLRFASPTQDHTAVVMSLTFSEVNASSACNSNNKMFIRQHKTTLGYDLMLQNLVTVKRLERCLL